MDLGCGSYAEGIDWTAVREQVRAFLRNPQQEHQALEHLLQLARQRSKSDCYIGLTTICYLALLFMDPDRLSLTLRSTIFGGVNLQEQIPLAYWDTISSGWPVFGILEFLGAEVRQGGAVPPTADGCCDRLDSDREGRFLEESQGHLAAGTLVPAAASLAYLAGAPARCSWGKATAYFALSERLLSARSHAARQAAKDMMVLGELQLDRCAEGRNVTVGEQMLSRWPFWGFLRRIEAEGSVNVSSQRLRLPPGYEAPPLPPAPRPPAPPGLSAAQPAAPLPPPPGAAGRAGDGGGAPGGNGARPAGSCDARGVHVALAGNRQHAEGALAVVNSAIRGAASPERLCLHLFCLGSEAGFYRSALRCSFGPGLRGGEDDFEILGAALRIHAFEASEVLTDGMAVDAGMLSEAGDLNAPHNFVRFHLSRWISPQVAPRLVYLDTDVIVRGDVCDLHDAAFRDAGGAGGGGGAAIAAVPRRHLPLAFYLKALSPKMPLWLPSTSPSFNAGVVVFDMVAWQRLNATSLVEAWAYRNRDRELWRGGSQPPLLLVLHDRVQWLRGAWNVDGLGHRRSMPEADLEAAEILHWTGPLKPWLPGGLHRALWEPFAVHCWRGHEELL